jgi:cellulose synthase/poly-beta-1,6-N-acetylglucosamine synthase-like glycosyltransferase
VTETNARAPAILLANQAQAPLVSIILPTYNGSQYLSEAIESCLHQTYENWELILVDDCSTDATLRSSAGMWGAILVSGASATPATRNYRRR